MALIWEKRKHKEGQKGNGGKMGHVLAPYVFPFRGKKCPVQPPTWPVQWRGWCLGDLLGRKEKLNIDCLPNRINISGGMWGVWCGSVFPLYWCPCPCISQHAAWNRPQSKGRRWSPNLIHDEALSHQCPSSPAVPLRKHAGRRCPIAVRGGASVPFSNQLSIPASCPESPIFPPPQPPV